MLQLLLVEITSFICTIKVNLFVFYFKFSETSNCFKRVLQSSKLVNANKARESVNCQKLGSCNFAKSFPLKDKFVIVCYINSPDVFASDRKFCLLKYFLKTRIFFCCRINLNLFFFLQLLVK